MFFRIKNYERGCCFYNFCCSFYFCNFCYFCNLRFITYAATPNATLTLSDSFLPSIGISIIWSHWFKMRRGIPETSLPMISAVFFLGRYFASAMLFCDCSSATISNSSCRNFLMRRVIEKTFSHGTKFSAPSAVFEIFLCGGVGVNPVKKTFSMPNASAVRNIEPTFSRERILWQMIYSIEFGRDAAAGFVGNDIRYYDIIIVS